MRDSFAAADTMLKIPGTCESYFHFSLPSEKANRLEFYNLLEGRGSRVGHFLALVVLTTTNLSLDQNPRLASVVAIGEGHLL